MVLSEVEIVREFLELDSLDLDHWHNDRAESPPHPAE
jgi:hypothetical protein